jgi:hypothetical protein
MTKHSPNVAIIVLATALAFSGCKSEPRSGETAREGNGADSSTQSEDESEPKLETASASDSAGDTSDGTAAGNTAAEGSGEESSWNSGPALSDETNTQEAPEPPASSADSGTASESETDATSAASANSAPGMVAALNLYGVVTLQSIIPPEAGTVVTPTTSAESLSNLGFVSDGESDAKFDCTAELPGSAGWSMQLSYVTDTELTKITASAAVDGDGNAETFLSVVDARTGGTTYASALCDAALGTVDTDRNAMVVEFKCDSGSELYDQANCSAAPVCDKTLQGTATFYLRSCAP